MKTNFSEICETREVEGALMVMWNDRSCANYSGEEQENFMKQYRIYLSQQEAPDDRICDLDRLHEDGYYSRDVENDNKRAMMNSEEREKFDRTENNFDGVFHLLNSATTLQKQTQDYIDNIASFQKNTIKAMQDNKSWLLHESVSKWELKRLESLIKTTTECREVGKKINAITLAILEDWII